MWNLEGKTALITGGTKGIGRAVVKEFLNERMNVIFTYYQSEHEAKKIEDQKVYGDQRVKGYQINFADMENVKAFSEELAQESIDYLINNAAINSDSILLNMNNDDWFEVMNVNLNALYIITKGASKSLIKRKGSIVNISSVSGIVGLAGQTNYSASKAGIIGFTKALSKEYGPLGVRVNAIAPGYINTDMTRTINEKKIKQVRKQIPLRRIGAPEDVSHGIKFLISDYASYMTGQTLVIDGGLT